MGIVVKFPAVVMADQYVRHLQRMIAMYEERIENCDPDSRDVKESVQARLAANLLPEYQADLRKALAARAALDAPDTIEHNGVIYAEMAGRA